MTLTIDQVIEELKKWPGQTPTNLHLSDINVRDSLKIRIGPFEEKPDYPDYCENCADLEESLEERIEEAVGRVVQAQVSQVERAVRQSFEKELDRIRKGKQ